MGKFLKVISSQNSIPKKFKTMSEAQYHRFYVYFLNFLTSLWDAMDHVYRRCEVSSGGILPSSGPKCYINLQCLVLVGIKGPKGQGFFSKKIFHNFFSKNDVFMG